MPGLVIHQVGCQLGDEHDPTSGMTNDELLKRLAHAYDDPPVPKKRIVMPSF